MNTKITIALLTVAMLVPATLQAQNADTAESTVAAKPAVSSFQSELRVVIQSINAKIKEHEGKVTAADLADDIKAFDAILAKRAGEKTEDVAQAAYMRATLYSQVLKDKATGDKLMEQLKADYKDTQLVERLTIREAAMAESEKLQAALAPGLPFPDFDEKDLDGKPLSVANFKGKVVLVDFWATWCGPCVGELPNVIETYKKYHDQGFEIIGISLDSDRAKLDAFLKKKEGMTWSQFFDGQGWENKLAVKYGVHSIPFTVLVGPDGKIIGKDLRGEALGEAVGKALAKK